MMKYWIQWETNEIDWDLDSKVDEHKSNHYVFFF